MSAGNAEFIDKLQALRGLPLWSIRRAADMATCQFGARRPTTDFYGRPAFVGDYAIHIQCAWRIMKSGRMLVASRDLYLSARIDTADPATEEEFSEMRTRRDVLISQLFMGEAEYSVRTVELRECFGLRLEMTDALVFEIMPDISGDREQWRLLCPGRNEPHLVVSGSGWSSE